MGIRGFIELRFTILCVFMGIKLAMPMPSSIIPQAADARQAGFSISNDAHYLTLGVLLDEDRYYSQGFHFYYLSTPQPPENVSAALQIISKFLRASGVASGLKLGQEIFTPNDLRMTTPLKDDRPFCGWTHLDLSQRFYWQYQNFNARLHAELTLGLIGPASFGKQVQVGWHDIRRQSSSHPELDPDPSQGWSRQLGYKGFPGQTQINLNYAAAFPPLYEYQNYKIESGTEAGLNAGSLYGNLEFGLQIRVGRLMRKMNQAQFSGNGIGWETYIFGQTKVLLNGWNAILNGGQSTEVELERITQQYELGYGLRFPHPWPELGVSISFWSRETAQPSREPFQNGHVDYRPDLQNRSSGFDHGFGTLRVTGQW